MEIHESKIQNQTKILTFEKFKNQVFDRKFI